MTVGHHDVIVPVIRPDTRHFQKSVRNHSWEVYNLQDLKLKAKRPYILDGRIFPVWNHTWGIYTYKTQR